MFFETSCSLTYSQTTGDITGQSLYNGNISNTTLAIGVPSPPSSFANNAVGYTHHYDQLNRLKKLRQYTGIAGTGTWDRSYITLNDQENITYDGNGNILTYGRNGGDTTAQTIDSLTYNYNYMAGKLINNQLQYIHDAVSSSGYDLDIRNQTDTANYLYDGIGNLIHDSGSIIRNIGWTVYNKPDSIIEPSGIISYAYNTANQRISKSFNGLTTWYVRDAQGNVLAVYDNTHGNINWREQHLYGSSRIGMWTPNINLADSNALDKWDTTGYRQFELDNHLGNVMTTINDVRVPYFKPSHIGPLPGPLQYFTGNVISYQDYYAFGMLMPDRQYTMTGDSSYRYGFNGKENDNEVAGLGNSQDYGERFYDVRIGRFRSVDPIASQYPDLSSYQFAGDNPILNIDRDGLEPERPRLLHSDDAVTQFMNDIVYKVEKKVYKAEVKVSRMSDKQIQDVVNKTAASILRHPDKLLRNAEKDLDKQFHELPNDVETFGDLIVNGENNKAKDFAENKIVEYAPYLLVPEEAEGSGVFKEGETLFNEAEAYLPQIAKNQHSGSIREIDELIELKKKYPNASIQGQRYLRNSEGKIVKDPVTGKGRRIDFAVVEDGQVRQLVETTSMTAGKRAQTAQENRIRAAGGVYIRDTKTGKLIDVSNIPTDLSRRP